jgi:plasmid maintenance system killer protein
MRIDYGPRALRALEEAPSVVRKAKTSSNPSLSVKKYDEAKDIWQARVNRNWRFYFSIVGDTYFIRDIVPHPK